MATILLLVGGLSACGSDNAPGTGRKEQIAKLSPLKTPVANRTNKYADDPRAATLGQRLFFEKRTSGPIEIANPIGAVGEAGKVSCATCHLPETWFQDSQVATLAVEFTEKNTTSAVNAAFYEWYSWTGKMDSLWSMAIYETEDEDQGGGTRLQIAHVLYDHYRDDYNTIFDAPLDPALDPASPEAARFPPSGGPKEEATDPDGPWEGMTPADQAIVQRIAANYGKAIEAYERLLVSRNAPFDRYVAGEAGAISAAAERGLNLFVGKAACNACHLGPLFSDSKFHVTGVPQLGDHVAPVDNARYEGIEKILGNPFNTAGEYSDDRSTGKLDGMVLSDSEKGKFRTKFLRQINQTGPYMHTGQYQTLTEVVEFYNRGGEKSGFSGIQDPLMVPLNLTAAEIADLVEFLKTLTGDPVAAALLQSTAAP